MDEPSLADFLRRLARDPELLDEFHRNKVSVINSSGLPADQQELLLNGTEEQIAAALGYELLGDEQIDIHIFM